ncbi:MAG: mechanosensitive ion channel [Nitrospirota bacterium]|nr:mechanosensitive ion channel [Nitrospirota bacterium]MDH4359963.1 mechanosensitive ion channel [Nitrospirota bacterium]MDH5295603.1 mechanosensitive ion channel [Nitrospirota bacterium]MDH5574351.1 mechanosensitive ion channel [Nitrospirota bacterium]
MMVGTQNELMEWGRVVLVFFQEFMGKLVGYLPQVLGAIIILVIGWLAAKMLKGLTSKVLRIGGIVELSKKIKFHDMLTKIGITSSLDQIMGGLVYYLILLLFFISASEVLGFKLVLDTLNKFVVYLPHILGAFLILIIALYLAKVIKDGIASASSSLNIAYAGALSSVLEILIVGFGIVMALTELGLDMTIFTANITIIIAGIVLAMALSIGLGSRSIMSNVLARYYIAQLFHVGDKVSLAGQKGTIIKITPVSIVIQTDDEEKLYIPNDRIIEEGSNIR